MRALILLSLGLAALIQPAEAQVARRNLACSVIPLVGQGTGKERIAIITNSLATTIAAHTVYAYTVGLKHFSYAAPNALAPGQSLAAPAPPGSDVGPCTASVPAVFKKDFNIMTAPPAARSP